MDCYLCEAHNQPAPLCMECMDGIEGALKDVRTLMDKLTVQTGKLDDAREEAFQAEGAVLALRAQLFKERADTARRMATIREACARYVEEVGLPDVADELRHHVHLETYL